MNRKRLVGVVAVGTMAALGAAGTALASGSDDVRPRPVVSASARAELSVSMAAARGIALRAAGGGVVESVERKVEHGRAVWDVDVLRAGIQHDIDVDSVSGAVLRHRIGGDDHGRGREAGDGRGRGHGRGAGDDHGRGGHGSDD